ncbi:MAG: hypothetical protein AAF490_13745, partial [Chloroflexota bacterium]
KNQEHLPSFDVAWADTDNEGDIDLVIAKGTSIINGEVSLPVVNHVYENDLVPANSNQLNAAPATIAIREFSTAGTTLPLLDTQSVVIENGRLDIEYTLTHPEDKPFATVRGFYSLDGGHTFRPAEPVSGTETANLASVFGQNRHAFSWDVYKSGFFGLSSQVVFRLEAYEVASPETAQAVGTYLYENQLGQGSQRGQVAVNSFPLRVRGNQLQVMFACDQNVMAIRPCPEDVSGGETVPLENAAVYGLPANNVVGGQILQSLSGQVFGTDGQGFLQGRTILSEGDQLIALWPVPTETLQITFTNRARLFYMSGQPNETSLSNTKVGELSGVQSITISNTNPLVLFDLIVSIEWDASQDAVFMAELDNAFKRASDILFDVTNGQVALGNVFVFHSKTYWNIADIVIVANNDLRPSAAIGGVVTTPIDEIVLDPRTDDPNDTKIIEDAYLPGQIRMGPNWDPFGQSQAELTEDWYRALAHELAHYFFFLPDDYLGLENGILRRIDCQGSFMTSTRDPAYSEFLNEELWEGDCLNTIAEQTTDRNNWETIEHFYPFFNIPTDDEMLLDGPNLLPIDVTSLISFGLDYGADRQRLPNRIFEIKDEDGDRIRVPNASVYMIQTQGTITETDDIYVNMGTTGPGGDRVQVRGAFEGDWLCIADQSQTPALHGCEKLDNADVSIALSQQMNADWNPQVEAMAVTSNSNEFAQLLNITVTQQLNAGEKMFIQVYPANYNSFSANWDLSPIFEIEEAGEIHTVSVPMRFPDYNIDVRVWKENTDNSTLFNFLIKPIWKIEEFDLPQSITVPITSNYYYILLGGPGNLPLGGPGNLPLGGPGNLPLGGPGNLPLGGPGNLPLGGPGNLPLGGPGNLPLGGPGNLPLGGPGNLPLGGPGNLPLGGPGNLPLGGPGNLPLGGPGNLPLGGPGNLPLGGPGNLPLGGPGNLPLGGPGNLPLGGANERSFNAPILSADAQLTIYNNVGFFEDNGVNSLQLIPTVTNLPPWFVQVGQAYRVEFDQNLKDDRSIAFFYLQRDVPDGFEGTLQIAFLKDDSSNWELLETEQFVENLVVSQVEVDSDSGSALNGVYTVVSTIALPKVQNGWNLFAYPIPVSRAITDGLGSLLSYTSMVVASDGSEQFSQTAPTSAEATLIPFVDVNIRLGPDINSEAISFLYAEESASIVMYEPSANWQQIICPPRSSSTMPCWVTGRPQYVEIEANMAVEAADQFEFGHVYWILIDGLAEGATITPYLAPPTLGVDGELR